MSDCFCDYESPSFFKERYIKASRKEHKCYECSRVIRSGEPYRYVSGKWDGDFMTHCTCKHCLDLIEYVRAHVPCFCWMFGSAHEDALETLRGYANVSPGLLFGYGRLKVAINRARTARTASTLTSAIGML